MTEIDQELQKYKTEVQQLTAQKAEIEKQIIIQDERIRSLKEQLMGEYGTDDEAELLKIKEKLEKEIHDLKEKINVE